MATPVNSKPNGKAAVIHPFIQVNVNRIKEKDEGLKKAIKETPRRVIFDEELKPSLGPIARKFLVDGLNVAVNKLLSPIGDSDEQVEKIRKAFVERGNRPLAIQHPNIRVRMWDSNKEEDAKEVKGVWYLLSELGLSETQQENNQLKAQLESAIVALMTVMKIEN